MDDTDPEDSPPPCSQPCWPTSALASHSALELSEGWSSRGGGGGAVSPHLVLIVGSLALGSVRSCGVLWRWYFCFPALPISVSEPLAPHPQDELRWESLGLAPTGHMSLSHSDGSWASAPSSAVRAGCGAGPELSAVPYHGVHRTGCFSRLRTRGKWKRRWPDLWCLQLPRPASLPWGFEDQYFF